VNHFHRAAICGCIRGSLSAILTIVLLCVVVGVTSFVPYYDPSLYAVDELHASHARMNSVFLINYFAQELVSVNDTSKPVWQQRISRTLASAAYSIPGAAFLKSEAMSTLLRTEKCAAVNCTYSPVNRTMPYGSLLQSVHQTLHMAAVLAAEKRESVLTPSNPRFLELWRINRGHVIPTLNATIARYNTNLSTSTDWVDSLFVLSILVSILCVLSLRSSVRTFASQCGPQSAEVLVTLLAMLPHDMQDFDYVLTGRKKAVNGRS